MPRGAVVLVKADDAGVRVLLREAEQSSDICAPPRVDGVVDDNPVRDIVVQVFDIEVVDHAGVRLAGDIDDFVFNDAVTVTCRSDHGWMEVAGWLKAELVTTRQ